MRAARSCRYQYDRIVTSAVPPPVFIVVTPTCVLTMSNVSLPKPPNWASPMSMGMKADNPVRSALLEAQATISKPVSKIANVDLLNYKNDKGQDAYDRLQEINSEIKLGGKTIMERLESRLPEWRERYGDLRKVQSPDNPDVTQSPIQNEIKELIADYREASRNQLFQEFPEIAKAIDNSRRFKNQSGSVLNQLRN